LAPLALPDMADAFRVLGARAQTWFDDEGIAPENRRVNRTVDLRYAGQNYELPIPLPEGEIGQAALDALAEGFATAHQRMYGFAPDDEPVQLVTYRIEAAGVVPKASFQPHKDAGPDASGAIMARREVWLPEAGGAVSCPIYNREQLQSGNCIAGPAIVEQMDATTVVLPGTVGRVDPYLNLILETL